MSTSPDVVVQIGAACFGLAVGFVTYRTLVRTTDKAAISDLAAVIGAVGGATVTGLFAAGSRLFGWYSIGLLAGMAIYFTAYAVINGKTELGKVMSGRTITIGGGTEPQQAPAEGLGPQL